MHSYIKYFGINVFGSMLALGTLVSCGNEEKTNEDTSSASQSETNTTQNEQENIAQNVTNTEDQYHYVWEDEFTESQKEMVKTWVDSVANSVQRSLGQYPFDITFTIFQYGDASEPCPWAHTKRGREQGVHFHINPKFDLNTFIGDWTAQHEISHLAIPFLGRQNAWFAEGFATFLQYQVMHDMGLMTQQELKEKYQNKLASKVSTFQTETPMVDLLTELPSKGEYSAMYWGGVIYFLEVDQQLKERGSSFKALLNEYQTCCRMEDHDLKSVINSFDELIGEPLFSKQLQRFRTSSAKDIIAPYETE